jgi:hypothetical protein
VLYQAIERPIDRRDATNASASLTDAAAYISSQARLAPSGANCSTWAQLRAGVDGESVKRIEDVADRAGLSKAQLDEIVRQPVGGDDRYEIPARRRDDNRVFSESMKDRIRLRVEWTNIGVLVLAPLLFAFLADSLFLEDAARWSLYAGALAVSLVLALLHDKWQPLDGGAALESGLRRRLDEEGLPISEGLLVGLGPHPEPCVYDNFTFWDIGLLFLTRDALYYVGERARFQLRRGEVSELSVRARGPALFSDRIACLRWISRGRHGGFFLQGARSRVRDLFVQERYLAALRRWRDGAAEEWTVPDALRNLPSPEFPEVECSAPYSSLDRQQVPTSLAVYGGSALIAALVTLRPFALTTGSQGAGWHAVLFTMIAATLLLLREMKKPDGEAGGVS